VKGKPSRAYKLKLSDNGIFLFLGCHCRLCHLVGDFLPYGTTLHVSVALLERVPTDDLLAEVQDAQLSAYGGKEIRFVGTSPQLAECTARLTSKIGESGCVHPLPQTWKLFLAALCCMQQTDDEYVVQVYDRLSAAESGMRPRRQVLGDMSRPR